uniref:RRM domain-containing protein n=1 Tax=Trichobilharzia regenti TaxID=157069 RepID=A0AA85KCL9_TRIRE|nr:unnamed protein product [Trichobilharzia regenti]
MKISPDRLFCEKNVSVAHRTDYKSNLFQTSHDGNAPHLRIALNRSPPTLTTGRPCLAGTQTLKHQQAEEKRISLNLTNESFFSLNARECTEESSGFDHVLSDQGNPSYFENENKYEGNGSNNYNNRWDPVIKSVYRPLEAQAKNSSVAVTASPSSSGGSTVHYACDDEFDYDSMVEQTHKIASKDFQTLDDNLTFIASYVEELTGCGTLAAKGETIYQWSGRLPLANHKSGPFSRKVFLGGLPWDSTSDKIMKAFSRFGKATVCWPSKDGSPIDNKRYSSRGYCYLIFEEETSVSKLLANCFENPNKAGYYYKMSSPKFVSKDVQVIPWVLSDDHFSKSTPNPEDTKHTVFVGALHALITAEAIVKIMDDIFGNVVYATLDTDRYKYPTGSARVVFSSNKSYTKAIIANFVNIRTWKFIKTIQIDPYLEDTVCSSCATYPGIYFCRALECFKYFCPACWYVRHKLFDNSYMHIPLRRGVRMNSDHQ